MAGWVTPPSLGAAGKRLRRCRQGFGKAAPAHAPSLPSLDRALAGRFGAAPMLTPMDDLAAVMLVTWTALTVVAVLAALIWAAVQDGHPDRYDRT